MERGRPVLVDGVDGGVGVYQEFGALGLAVGGRAVQRRPKVVISGLKGQDMDLCRHCQY